MDDLELVIITSLTLVAGVVAPPIVEYLHGRFDFKPGRRVAVSALLHTAIFVGTLLFYRRLIEPAEWWQRAFRPGAVSPAGDWLQEKRLVAFNQLAAHDFEQYPFSLLRIQYDGHEGCVTLHGVTASLDDEVWFQSTGMVRDEAKPELTFTFEAQVGAEAVSGTIIINFHPEEGDTLREASGYYVDSRGYRMDFKLRRIDAENDDLRSARARVRYLRDLYTARAEAG